MNDLDDVDFVMAGEDYICQFFSRRDEDFTNKMANARLIAAAPELLAAIEYLFTPGPGIAVPTPYENDMKEPHKMTWNKKLERLQAALHAAKGEQP